MFEKLRAMLVEECEELGQVRWHRQAADTTLGKARSGAGHIGPDTTERGKNGTKRSLLTDGGGGPLTVVVAGTTVHDTKPLKQTLETVVVKRPEPTELETHDLWLDKDYDNPTAEAAMSPHGSIGHIRRIGHEPPPVKRKKGHKARRWGEERTLAWLTTCRAILARDEKKSAHHVAVVQLAAALLWYRRRGYSSLCLIPYHPHNKSLAQILSGTCRSVKSTTKEQRLEQVPPRRIQG